MTSIICSVSECFKQVRAKGYCWQHYRRYLRYGDPLILRSNHSHGGKLRFSSDEAKYNFLSRIDIQLQDQCWEWKGSCDAGGYGRLTWQGYIASAHRIMYQLTYGDIPQGLEIDHLCSNRKCVNPRHLEAVTHKTNVQRGANTTRTYCKHGHLYNDSNTRINNRGARTCKICICIRQQIYWKKQYEILSQSVLAK